MASLTSSLRAARPPARRPRRDRGWALLVAALLTLLVGSTALVAVIAWRAEQPRQNLAQADEQLGQADHALRAFVAAFNRLPCPDADGDGVEDCGSGQLKGWLPSTTLAQATGGATPAPRTLQYLVERSAVNLAAAVNLWRPIKWKDNASGYAERHTPFNHITSADTCQALLNAQAAPLTVNSAQLAPDAVSGSVATAIAYAVIHPGVRDADGDGNPFDGVNATTGESAEAPQRRADARLYDDRVLARSYADLLFDLQCPQLLTSINAVGMAGDFVDEVNDTKISATVGASVTTAINLAMIAGSAVKMISNAVALATAIAYLGTATSLLATAIGACAVIVGCFEIPHAAASVAAAAAGVAASTVAIAVAASTIPPYLVAAGMTLAVAIKAGISTANSGGVDLTAATSQAYNAWQDAIAKRNDALNKLNDARAAEATQLAQRNTADTAMLQAARNAIAGRNAVALPQDVVPVTRSDPFVDTVRTRMAAWQEAEYRLALAEDQLSNAQSTKGNNSYSGAALNNVIAEIDAQIAAATSADQRQALVDARARLINANSGPTSAAAQLATVDQSIASIDAQVADLNTRIAAEADATTRAQYTTQRDNLLAQRARLVTQRSTMVLDPTTATQQRDARRAERNTAQTEYNNARQALIDASNVHYRVVVSCSGTVTVCIYADRYFDGRGPVTSAVDDYAAKYKNWYAKGKAVAVAQDNYNQAVANANDAQQNYNQIAALATGATAGGAAASVWNGAGNVLDGVDAKGGIR